MFHALTARALLGCVVVCVWLVCGAACVIDLQCPDGRCPQNAGRSTEGLRLGGIAGVTPCEGAHRIASAPQGVLSFRLFLVDDSGEAIDVQGLSQTPFTLSASDFFVHPDAPVRVFDAQTGAPLTSHRAQLSIAEDRPLAFHPNPRYLELRKQQATGRIPRALALWLGEGRAEQGAAREALVSWLQERLYEGPTFTPDLFSSLVTSKSPDGSVLSFFQDWPSAWQYIAYDGRPHGFLVTTPAHKAKIVDALRGVSAVSASSEALMKGVQVAARQLRLVAREQGRARFNPVLLALSSASKDASLASKAETERTQQALRGDVAVDDEVSLSRALPLMVVVDPKPPSLGLSAWDAYVAQLCHLAQASKQGRVYGGQVFLRPPGVDATAARRTQLDAALYASKGFVELSLRYRLIAPPDGARRVAVTFSLGAMWRGQRVAPSVPTRLMFEVQR